MAWDHYTRFFDKFDTTVDSYLTEATSNTITAFTPFSLQLFAIYIAVYGFALMRGMVQEPVSDFATRMIKTGFIIGVATSLGIYNDLISSFLWNAPDALAAAVASGTAAQSNVSFLDTLMENMYQLGDKHWKFESGLSGVGPKIIAIFIWAAGLLTTGYAAFLLILSKMMLAALIALGPLFILMMVFESTKRFFEVWLGQAMNFVFMVGLTAAVVKLILAILNVYLNAATGSAAFEPSPADALPALGMSAIAFLVLMQVAPVASALGGGVAMSTLGAASALWNKAKGAGGSMKDHATGKTLSDMRAQRRQKETNANWAKRNPGTAGKIYQKVTNPRANRVARG